MFICKKHRKIMFEQSEKQLGRQIAFWINKGVHHYRYKRWDHALPYIGCALETCWLQGSRQQSTNFILIEKTICLAIYCHNILEHLQDHEQGKVVLLRNYQWIVTKIGYKNKPDFLRYCLFLCKENYHHQEIISKHTNWPFLIPSLDLMKVLH